MGFILGILKLPFKIILLPFKLIKILGSSVYNNFGIAVLCILSIIAAFAIPPVGIPITLFLAWYMDGND